MDVKFLKVEDLRPHISDHSHLTYNINLTSAPQPNTEPHQTNGTPIDAKLTWSETTAWKVAEFFKMPETRTDIRNLNHRARNGNRGNFAAELNSFLQKILKNVGALKHVANSKPKQNVWFDNECKEQKRNLVNMGRLRTRHPDDQEISKRLQINKTLFRKLLWKKKRKHYRDTIERLGKLRSNKPRYFWNFGENSSTPTQHKQT